MNHNLLQLSDKASTTWMPGTIFQTVSLQPNPATPVSMYHTVYIPFLGDPPCRREEADPCLDGPDRDCYHAFLQIVHHPCCHPGQKQNLSEVLKCFTILHNTHIAHAFYTPPNNRQHQLWFAADLSVPLAVHLSCPNTRSQRHQKLLFKAKTKTVLHPVSLVLFTHMLIQLG